MGEDLVLVEVREGVARITLNNPQKANALSRMMMDRLEDALLLTGADESVRVVVLRANGRIFCAGHDLEEMLAHDDREWQRAHFERCSRMMMTIRSLAVPVVARVQGAAVAAGCQLVATCDLAIAADHAKFGVNGINLGLFCSTPSVALSRAIAPKKALELALTGELISAGEAERLGLINKAVPIENLDADVERIVETITAKLPDAIALGKRLFWQQHTLGVEDAYALASDAMSKNMDVQETRTGIRTFIEKGRKS